MENIYLKENNEVDRDSLLDEESLNNPNLPNWKKVPRIADLRQELSDATQDHQVHVNNINRWLDNLNVTGKAAIKSKEGFSSIVPKLIRKQAEWRYASLSEPFLSTDDIFDTQPVTYEDKDAAVQNGLVLNNQFNTKIDKIRFIDEYIRTAVDEGTVIVRVGWDLEEEEVQVEVPQYTYKESDSPDLAAQYQQLTQLAQQSPEEFTNNVPVHIQKAIAASEEADTLIEAVFTHTETETQINTIKNCPTLEVCKYTDVIVDPTCQGDLNKASFIIYTFETSYSQLKKEGRYFDLDKITESDNQPTDNINSKLGQDYVFHFKDKPRRKFIAYEYWGFWDVNGDGTLKPIVATWVGDTLIRMEDNPFPDQKLPFISVQYLPVRKSVYGQPDGELLEDNQKIIGAVTRGMIDIMGRSANGQKGIRGDALDVVNSKKFSKGMDYQFNGIAPPEQLIYMHKFPEIPKSAEVMIQMQNAEAESLTGIKAFSSGISGQALGKMLDITTDIPLMDGTFKKLADVNCGDSLVGSDGKCTTVLVAHEIHEPNNAYNMKFSNGSTVCSGGEHLWTVKVNKGNINLFGWLTLDANSVFKFIGQGYEVVIPRIKGNQHEDASSNTVTLESMHTTDIVPMRCLTVDSADKLFAVTDKYTLTHNTATGIRSALDATSKRELGILRRMAEGIKQIGRKMVSMNSEFLSEEEIIRITNDKFITVRRDDLEGNIDLILNISTAEADEQKATEMAFMLQTIAPKEDPDIRRMLLSEIFKLRKMPELAKKVENYQPPPDELAIKKAQTEVALLQAQVHKEASMAEENLANARLYDARVGLESARAVNTSSDTDLKDLKYVEQESGTLHARELDKDSNKEAAKVASKPKPTS